MTWTAGEAQRQYVRLKGFRLPGGEAIGLSGDFAVCPLSRRALGTTTSRGLSILQFSFREKCGAYGSHDLTTFSGLAVLQSLLIAAVEPRSSRCHKSQACQAGR